MSGAREVKLDLTPSLDPDKSRNLRLMPVIAQQAAILHGILEGKNLEDFKVRDLVLIGLTFNEKSNYAEAKIAFTLALEKLPAENLSLNEKALIQAQCQYGLANIERELGHEQQAIDLFLQARQAVKQLSRVQKERDLLDYEVERNLGIAYLKVGDYAKAACCFKHAIETASSLVNGQALIAAVTSYYGLSLVLDGQVALGFEQLTKARALYPLDTREQSMDWASHRYHMGRALESRGEFNSAILEYLESLRLRVQVIDQRLIGAVYYHSRVGDLHAALGACYLSLQEFEAAQLWLDLALADYRALNNVKRIQQVEALQRQLPTAKPADIPTDKPVAPNESLLNSKYFRYGLGAAALLGVSFFAFRLLKETNPQPAVSLLKARKI